MGLCAKRVVEVGSSILHACSTLQCLQLFTLDEDAHDV